MTLKYKIYGLTAEEADIGIRIARHLKNHAMWHDARNARTDGIQRANCEQAMAQHGADAESLIRKLNGYVMLREY